MNNTYTKGVFLFDILVAFALVASFMTILLSVFIDTQDLFNFAKIKSSAIDTFILHENDFNDLGFYEKVNIDNIFASAYPFSNDGKEIDIDIFATTSRGIYKKILSFVKIIPRSDIIPPNEFNNCSMDFINNSKIGLYDFVSPNRNVSQMTMIRVNKFADFSFEKIFLPITSNNLITDFFIRDKILFVSTNSNLYSDSDIFSFDISSTSAPVLISSLDTGPGINSFYIKKPYVYVANDSTAYQLNILKINFDNTLNYVSRFKLPLPYATATPTVGSSIVMNQNKVYLGTEKWDGYELNKIDVSNINSPSWVMGINNDSKINDLLLDSEDLYMTGSGIHQFRVFDLSNNNFVLKNDVDLTGWNRQEGVSQFIFEGSFLGGRTSGGFNITTDPEFIYFSSSSLSTLTGAVSKDVPGGVYGVIRDRLFTYIFSRKFEQELQVSPNTHDVIATTTYFHIPVIVKKVRCDNGNIYLSDRDNPIIYKINFVKHE
jgi:hypothetical protein